MSTAALPGSVEHGQIFQREPCPRSVAINLPCRLSEGHDGVCIPDPEQQLKVWGITLEDLLRIQADYRAAVQMRVAQPNGQPTAFGRHVRLRAALERLKERARWTGQVYVFDIEQAIQEAESYEALELPRLDETGTHQAAV